MGTYKFWDYMYGRPSTGVSYNEMSLRGKDASVCIKDEANVHPNINKWITYAEKKSRELGKIGMSYTPKRILYNANAVIVFWNDNTKTVVKLAFDDEWDLYNAFCIALTKKIYGSNSAIKRWIDKTSEEVEP